MKIHNSELSCCKGEVKEPQQSSVDGQNCQLTSGEVNQSIGIIDTYADDIEHRYTPSPEDVGLWKEFLHKEITYWLEREALLKFSAVVDHFPIPSE